jgi:hypothetical protein
MQFVYYIYFCEKEFPVDYFCKQVKLKWPAFMNLFKYNIKPLATKLVQQQ